MTRGAFGLIATSVFAEFASSQGLYAILGMGAVAAAVLGAPISTTIMVFELTGGSCSTSGRIASWYNRGKVADFMQPLPAGEGDHLPEAEREIAVRASDSLETALRVFDTTGAERIPVVDPHDPSKIVGFAQQVQALAWFHRELTTSPIKD
jgi:CIC family chloride channel protein